MVEGGLTHVLGTVGAFLCVSLFLQEASPDSLTGWQKSSQPQKGASANVQALSKSLLTSHLLMSIGQSKSYGQAGSRGLEMDSSPKWERSKVMWPSAVHTGMVGILQPSLPSATGCASRSAGGIGSVSSSF